MTRCRSGLTVMVVGLGVLLTMVQFASAQQQHHTQKLGIGIFSGATAGAYIIKSERVQKELKVTEEQAAKLTKISERFRGERRRLLHSGGVEIPILNAKLTELRTVATAEINDVLDDAQKRRFQEIRIFVNGVRELTEPDVAETLKITEDQQNEMKEARTAFLQSLGDLREETRNMTNAERQLRMREIRGEAGKAMLAVLSDEQRAAFEKMKVGFSESTEAN